MRDFLARFNHESSRDKRRNLLCFAVIFHDTLFRITVSAKGPDTCALSVSRGSSLTLEAFFIFSSLLLLVGSCFSLAWQQHCVLGPFQRLVMSSRWTQSFKRFLFWQFSHRPASAQERRVRTPGVMNEPNLASSWAAPASRAAPSGLARFPRSCAGAGTAGARQCAATAF